MDDAERTASNPFEVPADLLHLLRDIAVEGVERAAEHPDIHGDDGARQRLWDAVVLWGRISYSVPSASEIADLADNAIAWLKDPEQHPLKVTDRERLAAQREHLGLLERLFDLRDEAAAEAARIQAAADDRGERDAWAEGSRGESGGPSA